MSVIEEREKEALAREFSEKLVDEVKLVVFTQEAPCMSCRDTVELAKELAGITPKITANVHDFVKDQMKANEHRIDKIPAIAVVGKKDHGIRFYGTPTGYEFKTFVGAIIDVSRGESGLSEKTKEALRTLDQAVHLRVFVTPTCPYCPPVVRLAHKMAIESDMVWSEMIEANEFIPLAQKHGVTGVPKTIINDEHEISGAVPEDVLTAHILNAVSQALPLQPR